MTYKAKGIVCGLIFCITIPAFADKKSAPLTFTHPANYSAKCKEYLGLKEKGLTVKAERLAENYRQKYLNRFFKLKPNEKRLIRITNEFGWYARKMYSDSNDQLWLDEVDPDSASHDGRTRIQIGVFTPKKQVEAWEDLIAQNYPNSGNNLVRESFVAKEWKNSRFITAVVVQIDSANDSKTSFVQDCFRESYDVNPDISITGGIFGKITLKSYKLGRRRKDESPRPETTEIKGENSDSDTKEPPSNEHKSEKPVSKGANPVSTVTPISTPKPVPPEEIKTTTSIKRTDDLHADMINAILTQHPERYEFIKEVLIADPDRVDAMTMKIAIDIDSKFNSKKKTETIGLLTSAVIAKDFQMVKLLIENGANICDGGPNNNLCAWGIAKKLGYQDMLDIMQAELQRRYEESKKKKQ